MASICTSNLTSGFIDLATYDEQEKYMYGGRNATAYFVRETRKSTWFTQVPVVLSKCSGSPAFGQEWSVQISRAGDYLLQTWLRIELPEVCITSSTVATNAAVTGATGTAVGCVGVRWTRNLGHAIIRECCLTFNDLVAARFDNYHLDFWAAFTTPAGKQNGYDNMIGNIGQLAGLGDVNVLPAAVLNVPLPFFYTRDSGVALPTAALPYNDMRIQFQFRNLGELLIADHCQLPTTALDINFNGALAATVANGDAYGAQKSICLDQSTISSLPAVFGNLVSYVARRPAGQGTGPSISTDPTAKDGNLQWGIAASSLAPTNWKFCNGQEPKLGSVCVWANYAIVSNDERKRMACAPRDILIEQVQTAPPCGFAPKNVNTPEQYDIRFSHAIKVLFFAVRNKTLNCEHANYTTAPAYPILNCINGAQSGTLITTARSYDPVAAASLLYENTYRLANMGSDFYSLVEPWYKAPTIPDKTGYHMYSYSLDFFNLDPMGSTNYGKLTNVSLYVNPSQAAVENALDPGCSNVTGAVTANAGFVHTSACSTASPTVGAIAAGLQNNVRYCQAQSYEFIVTAVNNNIVRISGGALGFPVL